MTDTAELRTRIAEAIHRADCGCTDEPGQFDDYYLDSAVEGVIATLQNAASGHH